MGDRKLMNQGLPRPGFVEVASRHRQLQHEASRFAFGFSLVAGKNGGA